MKTIDKTIKDQRAGYVIAFVYDGRAIAVIDAREDHNDHSIFLDHTKAMESAKRMAVTRNIKLYDLSSRSVKQVEAQLKPGETLTIEPNKNMGWE